MKALILVDLEKEYIDPNSDYYLKNTAPVIKRVNKLIDFYRGKRDKIIFIKHVEKGSNSVFAEHSQNIELITALHHKEGDAVIVKNKISSFYKTNLEKELGNIKEIIICGFLTNLCVRSLAEEAYDRDFKITIVKDCCKAFDTKTQEFTLKDLKVTREEIKMVNMKDVLRD